MPIRLMQTRTKDGASLLVPCCDPRYAIGQQFTDRKGRLCTVSDILTTRNHAGEPVKLRYAVTHEFCGQTVTDNDVLETTIARALEAE